MSFVNFEAKEIICKIIYYGPGLSGKTTNIKYIAANTKEASKGKLISLNTETERTLFFDFLPLALGKVNDYNIRFHLYSVPGQIFYETSRRLLIKGIDGIIFVADSSRNKFEANLESMNSLIKDLYSMSIDISDIPFVIQYNKRDVDSAIPVKDICHLLNKINAPEYETIATEGIGIFETLKGISKQVMINLKKEMNNTKNHEQ